MCSKLPNHPSEKCAKEYCSDRYKIDYTLQARARIAGSRFKTQPLTLDAFGMLLNW
jgi:hypothetical protein